MGKAWNTGSKKPLEARQPIYRRGDGFKEPLTYWVDMTTLRRVQVSRSWAEHQVCSGEARYVLEN